MTTADYTKFTLLCKLIYKSANGLISNKLFSCSYKGETINNADRDGGNANRASPVNGIAKGAALTRNQRQSV